MNEIKLVSGIITVLSVGIIFQLDAGTVQRIYIKNAVIPQKGNAIQLVCDVSQFSEQIVNVYKTDSALTDTSVLTSLTACLPSRCTKTSLGRYLFSTDSSHVYIDITSLKRSEDQKWWGCAVDEQIEQLQLTVYTVPQTLYYDNPPSQDQNLAQNAVTLKCQTGCSYPQPSFSWFYNESGGSSIQWSSSGSVSEIQDGCSDSEKKYTSALLLPKDSSFPDNMEKTVTFVCSITSFPGMTTPLNTGPSVNIEFAVPITSITMIIPSTSTVTANENTEVEFKCRTSGGLPAASIRWYKDSGTSGDSTDDLEITSGTASTSSAVNDLTVVTSTLRYSPSRNENGWRIYCAASNVLGQSPLFSARNPLLDVQYPPGPPVITGYSDGDEYRVIENTQGRLSCSVTGGNPAPTLTWDCINSGMPETISGATVTKTHTWAAQRNQDRTCTCRSSNYSGDRTVSIKIKVLYGPDHGSLKLTPSSATYVQNEGDIINDITCSTKCFPVCIYRWTKSGASRIISYTAILSLGKLNEKQAGTYKCTATNPETKRSVSKQVELFVRSRTGPDIVG